MTQLRLRPATRADLPRIHQVRNGTVDIWQPWIAWAYGAGFDRQTEQHALDAGLQITDRRYVIEDLLKLLTLRVAVTP